MFSASASLDQGVRAFGASHEEEISEGEPRSQFTRGTLEVSYLRPFEVDGQKFFVSSQILASASPHTLPSNERLVIGGRPTVRGFENENLSGDIGGFTRNELIWALPPFEAPEVRRALGGASLFAAYDAGWIKSDDADPFERGLVSGLAAGLRFTGGTVFGELSAARALSAPSFFDPKGHLLYFRLGLSSEHF